MTDSDVSKLPRFRLDSPYVFLVFPPLFWASLIVVGRGVVGEIPPVALAFWSWVWGLIALLPVAGRDLWMARRIVVAEWKTLACFGATGIVIFNILFFVGMQTTEAVTASLLNAMDPIMTVGWSWLFFRERLTSAQSLGVAFSLAGCIGIITDGRPAILFSQDIGAGQFIVLISYLSWALYTVLLRRFQTRLETLPFLAAVVGVSVLMMLPIYVWEISSGRTMPFTAAHMGVTAYMGLVPSVLAYLLWVRGVERIGPNKAGFYQYLIPVYGTALAAVFLGERVGWYHGAGILFIFLGIYLAVYRGQTMVAASAEPGAE